MFDCEEFWDGTFSICQPGNNGKILGVLVVTSSGGVRTEDWYLVTNTGGNNDYSVYVWPGATSSDVTVRYLRTGAGSNPPTIPSGVVVDHFRCSPSVI